MVVPAHEASTGLEAVPVCATLGGSEVVLTLRILVVVEAGLVLGRSVDSEAVLILPSSSGWSARPVPFLFASLEDRKIPTSFLVWSL